MVQSAVPLLTSFVLRLVGAVALWIIGRWLDYWQVYFDTNRTIREAFGSAGFAAPEQRVRVRSAS